MMLQFDKRINRLLSISIRVVDLEFTKYRLKVKSDENVYYSPETERTLLPKFEIDKRNEEISHFLMNTSKTQMLFSLVKNSTEEIEIFGVDLGELIFLTKDLSEANIKSYPIIIFEFMEGFYTTKELFRNNTFNLDLSEHMGYNNISITKNQSLILNNKKSNLSNASVPSLNNSLAFLTVNNTARKEISFSSLHEKYRQYEFFEKQAKILETDKEEKLKQLNVIINSTSEAYKKYYSLNEKMKNIAKIRNEILNASEKIASYSEMIETLKRLISQKRSDLHTSSGIFSSNTQNFKEKIQGIDKNKKKMEKYKFLYNAFKKKKISEITYFFFNKECFNLYMIPPFFSSADYNSINKAQKISFFDKNCKETAIMLGTVAYLLNILSRQFNITLSYPLFILGSKSYIRLKEGFVSLLYITKNEDKLAKFEVALGHLHENLRDVLKFFKLVSTSGFKERANFFNDFLILAEFLKGNLINNNLNI